MSKRKKHKLVPMDVVELDELEGDGLFDWFRPRDSYNNTSRKTLEQYGKYQIVGITLSRAPIQSMLRKALDVVSLGAFSKAVQKYGFDKLFHLSMLVDLDANGSRRRVVVEKNAVINISPRFKAESDAEYLPIQINRAITLDELMENTKTIMGDRYFPYNAWNNNCQVFIREVLASNGLNSKTAQDWLFQDITQLAQEIPEVSKEIANAVTYTGAVVDKLSGNGRGGTSPIAPCKRKSKLKGGSMDRLVLESIERVKKKYM